MDPKKRPRVEDLEGLPALQPAMTAARALAAEHAAREQRERDRKNPALAAAAPGGAGAAAAPAAAALAAEQRLQAREAAVAAREAACLAREGSVEARHEALLKKESETRGEGRRLQQWADSLAILKRQLELERDRGRAEEGMVVDWEGGHKSESSSSSSSSSSSISSSSIGNAPTEGAGFVIHADPESESECPEAQPAADTAAPAHSLAPRDDISSGVRRARELLGKPHSLAPQGGTLGALGALGVPVPGSLPGGAAGALRPAPGIPFGAPLPPSSYSRPVVPIRTGAEGQKENVPNVFAYAAGAGPGAAGRVGPGQPLCAAKDKGVERNPAAGHNYTAPLAAGNGMMSPFKKQRVVPFNANYRIGGVAGSRPITTSNAVHHVDLQTKLETSLKQNRGR